LKRKISTLGDRGGSKPEEKSSRQRARKIPGLRYKPFELLQFHSHRPSEEHVELSWRCWRVAVLHCFAKIDP
jgi:hypothetical protein